MSKRRYNSQCESSDKYRQTHIYNYFMNSRNALTIVKKQNSVSNKENDSEESIVSPRKKPRPIPSDEDNQDTDINLNTMTSKKTNNLPKYTYSEGSDTGSTVVSSTPKKRRTVKRRLFNSNRNAKTVVAKEIVDISSDEDDDFEKIPKKITNIKGEAKNSTDLKKKKLQRHETNSETCTSASETIKPTKIGVHKPKVITSTQKETKVPILKSTNNNTPNLSVTASTKSISMNITTQKASPPTSKNVNLDRPITSPEKLKILQNVILNTPKKKSSDLKRIKIKESTQSVKPLLNIKVKDTKLDASKADDEEEKWSPIALRIFKKIETFVMSHSNLKALLEEEEIQLLQRFNSMKSEKYKFLCLKLYFRIHKWYNIFKLCDILKMELSGPEVKEMYECLSAEGLVENDFSQDPCIELLNNLHVKELKDICDSFKLKLPSQKKADLIRRLLTNCNNQTTLTSNKSTEEILRARIKDKMGYCVKLHPVMYRLFYKVHLMYSFTTSDFNTTSDLYLFLSKAENKEIIIPKYKINTNLKVFSSISTFSRFTKAHECKRLLLDCWEKKDLNNMLELCKLAFKELKILIESGDEILCSSYMMRFTAGHKYARALSFGAKHLARHYPQDVEEWLTFLIEQDRYNVQMRGNWYDVLVLVQYTYLKEIDTAATTIREALQRDDLSQISYYELNNRAEMIKQNKTRRISELQRNNIACVQCRPIPECGSIEITARHIHENQSGRKRVYTEKNEDGRSILTVEQVALKHYQNNGYKGFHCESSLVTTILFVLFWDIIYESPVQDAFILEIQYLPLDLYGKEFYSNRKSAVDQRLKEISSDWALGQLENFIEDIWKKHSYEKSFIIEDLVDKPRELYNIIMCIGRDKIALLLRRMIEDFRNHHAGLPDLFLWNYKQKKCKFVEVKGEKDRLSIKQKLWLDFLLENGLDAEVCYVKTIGSKYKAKRNVKKDEK